MVADLATLVSIDSGTANHRGVNLVQDWIAKRGAEWGGRSVRRPVEGAGDQLLVRWSGEPEAGQEGQTGPRVLLCGHADTVYPDGVAASRPLSHDPSRPAHLLGPGAADMKAGLVSALYAVQAMRATGARLPRDLALAVVPDEEAGSMRSVDWLLELATDFDAALVLEPARPSGDVVTARKGGGLWTLTVTGRSAHAGVEPEAGASALLQMAHHALDLDTVARGIDGASLVLGTLTAGTAPNVVPESARMTIDARAFAPEALDALARGIELSVRRVAGTVGGTTSHLEGGISKAPMPRTERTGRMFELAADVASTLGITLHECATGGNSDANTLAAAGVTVLDGLGPVGGHLHSPEEYVDGASLVPRTALLAGLLGRLGESEIRS
jgi:glutamate carboxypeptidase